jgi:putative ABC transport system permease protein
MLELKNITKNYKTGNYTQQALIDISISFRKKEFVSILGPSGSGKTTLLNIIGGLDKYTSGDLIINGTSTKQFKDRNWDSYRNSCIGFVFQSYNLISHISIIDNVMMSMTLSNVNPKIKRKKALEALKKVGLINHINKRPNQLSGGQMQRVAIARAIVNDPDIILADEPTGALDSKTSIQIMDLIKEIAKDKLVIMVTHNAELANAYSTRIVELADGKIISDSNPITNKEKNNKFNIRKTSMKFKTALKLSFNNIRTKKGRTFLTSFASSIGIIGIATILSLSNGFDKQIDKFEQGILSAMPIVISEQSVNLDNDTINELSGESLEKYPDIDYVIPSKNQLNLLIRKNIIDEDYINYLESMPTDYAYGYSYNKLTSLNLLSNTNGNISLVDTSNINLASIPVGLDGDNDTVINAYYDTLIGHLPQNKSELLLIVDANNQVDESILKMFGFNGEDNVSFEDLLNASVHLFLNDDYYIYNNGTFKLNADLTDLYNNHSIELKISGIARMKDDFPSYTQSSAVAYTPDLISYIIENNSKSKIVEYQKSVDYNVLTGMNFATDDASISSQSSLTKEQFLAYIGDESKPTTIYLYPRNFESKDKLLEYLDEYNQDKEEENKIVYTDQAKIISSMSGSIMSAITYVLVAFSSISLIVSSIMISVITYISVLERTKEIGILRALGARKKDITRVFNAETFIIGVCSGLIGIIIARILIIPINSIIYKLTELSNVAVMNPVHALILIIISTLLTMIGGLIPARLASKKDPVIALRKD